MQLTYYSFFIYKLFHSILFLNLKKKWRVRVCGLVNLLLYSLDSLLKRSFWYRALSDILFANIISRYFASKLTRGSLAEAIEKISLCGWNEYLSLHPIYFAYQNSMKPKYGIFQIILLITNITSI